MSKTADNTPGSNGGALTLESLQRDVSAFKKLYPDLRSRPNLYDYLAGRDNPGLAQSRLNARVNIVLQEFHWVSAGRSAYGRLIAGLSSFRPICLSLSRLYCRCLAFPVSLRHSVNSVSGLSA